MRCRPGLFLATTLLLGCTDLFPPGHSPKSVLPAFTIQDGAHSLGNGHFFFLPPMVAYPTPNGAFDSTISPVVQICDHTTGSCATPALAVFTMTTGPGSETVRIDTPDSLYIVNWHTDQFQISNTSIYRIQVLVAGATVGFADVEIVPNSGAAKNVTTGQDIPLLDGKTLPIKFRVEQGMVVAVSLTPNPDTIVVQKRGTLTATLTDGHGNIVTGQSVTWHASNTNATVDAFGNVSGVALGIDTITASSNAISGSAQVVIIRPPVASVTIAPDPASVAAGQSVQLSSTEEDVDGNVLAGRIVTWTSADTTIAKVSGTGLVSGVAPGLVTITATSEGKSGSGQLTVNAAGFTLLQISVGVAHGCGLTSVGTAYCWPGSNSLAPEPVPGGLSFVQISAGNQLTCAITADGILYCWGRNDYGQVGDGTNTARSVPTPVSTNLRFTRVAAAGANVVGGPTYACALAADGSEWCWGATPLGTSNTPFLVPGGHTYSTVMVALTHACSIDLTGQAWCFGNGATNALGNHGDPQPVSVIGGHVFTSITGGEEFTCALDPTGQAWCWGTNDFGIFANGTTNATWGSAANGSLAPVQSAAGYTFTSLQAGDNHICGLTQTNDVYCWGWNKYGQLGDGSNNDSITPVHVAGGFRFTSLGLAGANSSCAITGAMVAYCWGNGEYAQLGTGSLSSANAPTRVGVSSP